MKDPTDAYTENVGRPPEERFPRDHPDRWQWDYRGSKADRERLGDYLGLDDDDPDEPPSQDESLFDVDAA